MPHACELPAELTIYTIGEFYPQCLNWVTAPTDDQDDGRLRVAAAAVAEVDAAGVQLLLSLSNSLQRQHRRLTLVDPSAALMSAVKTLGACNLMRDADLKGVAP